MTGTRAGGGVDQGRQQVVDERYEPIELVGTGGMSEVWRAFDRKLHRDVALKILSGPAVHDASNRKRVEREARALAALSHPNIVAVFDYGESASLSGHVRPYVVMELVEGPDLHRYLEARGSLEAEEASRLLGGVLAAVDHAHAAGIVHGDLKPANILIDDGVPKVGDFGVARIFSEETGTTTVAATPTFAAPEVLRGERPTKTSDVYSVACLAFQMLTGRPPYEGANAWEVAAKHMEDPVPHATQLRDDVPVYIDEAVRRGMDKDPRHRFRSAAEFKNALAVAATVPVPTSDADAGVRVPTEVLSGGPDLRAAALYGPLAAWTSQAPHRWRAVRERIRGWRVAPVMVAAVLVVAIPLLLVGLRNDDVRIPDVAGQDTVAGSAALRDAGLAVHGVSYEPITTGEPGRIVRTIPEARTLVKLGTKVDLVVTAMSVPSPTPATTEESLTAHRGRGKHDRGGGGEE